MAPTRLLTFNTKVNRRRKEERVAPLVAGARGDFHLSRRTGSTTAATPGALRDGAGRILPRPPLRFTPHSPFPGSLPRLAQTGRDNARGASALAGEPGRPRPWPWPQAPRLNRATHGIGPWSSLQTGPSGNALSEVGLYSAALFGGVAQALRLTMHRRRSLRRGPGQRRLRPSPSSSRRRLSGPRPGSCIERGTARSPGEPGR